MVNFFAEPQRSEQKPDSRCSMYILFCLAMISLTARSEPAAWKTADYLLYHREMIKADEYMVSGNYRQALQVMDHVFRKYDFVFLRDYQIAAQVAAFIGDQPRAIGYLERGAAAGWKLGDINRIRLFAKLKSGPAWPGFLRQYPKLHQRYLRKLDIAMAARMRKMFLDDQQLAAQNLKINDEKAQEEFLMQRFVP